MIEIWLGLITVSTGLIALSLYRIADILQAMAKVQRRRPRTERE